MSRLAKHTYRSQDAPGLPAGAGLARCPGGLWFVSFILLGMAACIKAEMADTYATDWQKGARGAYSFTFESGMPGQWQYAAPILTDRGMRGTFFLNGGSVVAWYAPNQVNYVHIPEMLLMAGAGHEIAAHAYDHLDLVALDDADIRGQVTRDLELFQYFGIYPVSFAYPFSQTDARVEAIVGQYVEFARGGYPMVTNSSSWNELDPLDLRWSSRADDHYACVDSAIATGTWAIGVFHKIGQKSHQNEPSVAEFTAFADYVVASRDAGDLWVDTVEHVASYIRERHVATVTDRYDAETKTIHIYLKVDLGHPYTVPLTLRTSIEESEMESVYQSEMPIEYKVVKDGSGRVVQYDAVPDGGEVRIKLRGNDPGQTLESSE